MGVPFPQQMKVKPGETVVFSFIVYKSRAHRDAVNAKVMKDTMMNDPQWKDKPMPFDTKRMAYGGFKSIVDV
jgi:alkaline phosphatase